ncbi:thimet oligopeptidase-like [Convolutriloba macropyga]|uniref:thimet oligopeptidase-like n=1 Tax=Convolutriloba macropyga TaxID=536237 RepID=UPI003F528715
MASNIRLNFNLSTSEIRAQCDDVIKADRLVLDEIAGLSAEMLTKEAVLVRLSEHSARQNPIENNLDFLHHIHPQEDIRDASTEADKRMSEHHVEMQMRKDVFDNLRKFQQSSEGAKLDGQSKRLIDRLVKNGLRSGLHLEESVRNEIKAIKKRLSDISIDFQKNVNDENTTFLLTDEQLKGVPRDFLDARRQEDGKYLITLKYPDYFPVQKKCVLPETRKMLQTAFDSRCKDLNAKLLEEAAALRARQASILDYPNHADYVLELRMAKKQKTVAEFLADLSAKLKPSAEKEMALYLQYKAEDAKENGFENDGRINMWDFRYYMNKTAEIQYSVDHEKLKEYFPVDVVTEGLLGIYQQLLHLEFQQISDGPTWHPEVELYQVTDADSGEIMGYFYLDLYPRDGKFSHAACFPLQSYSKFSDGSVQYPVCAMVSNFPKAVGDTPALFTHDDVETFFHEFGHVMHNICARSEYAMFGGTRVERDFVEAPSQMLENWVWHPEPLARLSKHYKDQSPIPKEMLEKLAASRKANAGIFNLRQVMLSAFDQSIHIKGEVDVTAEYTRLCEEIMGVGATPGTCMPASFEHVIDGYDAQYYGYLWSEVYSADMFASRFGKEGVMNPETGLSYRKCILQPGGSKDAIEMLRDFLGREPNSNAFLIEKGLVAE